MGKAHSKEEVVDDHSKVIQATEVNTSTGLHVFEFHLPTAGLSLGTVLLICFTVWLVIYVKKRCKCVRRHRPNPYDLPVIYQPAPRPIAIPSNERFVEIHHERPPPAAHVHAMPENNSQPIEECTRAQVHQNKHAAFQWEPLPPQ